MTFDYFAFPASDHSHYVTVTQPTCQNDGNDGFLPGTCAGDDDEDFETVSGFDSLAPCPEDRAGE